MMGGGKKLKKLLDLDECHIGVEALAGAIRGGACANFEEVGADCTNASIDTLTEASAAGACPKLNRFRLGISIPRSSIDELNEVVKRAGRDEIFSIW